VQIKTLYSGKTIHQVLPNLTFGDAISDFARAIRRFLIDRGASSRIFVLYHDELVADECTLFSPHVLRPEDTILYHHSIDSGLTPHIEKHKGSKCLIYHNVTPGRFYRRFQPGFADILDAGREELNTLASIFSCSIGVSTYNCDELLKKGFSSPHRLPLIIDPTGWDCRPDPTLMQRLSDRGVNILFTGRIAPHKYQDHLVEAFAWLQKKVPDAHLSLVGQYEVEDPYYHHVRKTVEIFHLENSITFTGKISREQLCAYYQTADLFWSMSEHEGFGVPLIEAMWFDIPVFAYKCSAIPETLGRAAFMFTEKSSMVALAMIAKLLLEDKYLRRQIVDAQRRRREELVPETAYSQLGKILSKL